MGDAVGSREGANGQGPDRGPRPWQPPGGGRCVAGAWLQVKRAEAGEQEGQHRQIHHHSKAQGQRHEQADVERAFKAAEHQGGKAAAQDDGGDDDGLAGGEEGPPQGFDRLTALLEQDAVFGEEMQGVVNGNAEGDGEDDGGRHLQIDVQRAHEPGDEQQRKHVGHEGNQGHAQTAEQQAHDEGDDAEGDEQAQHHVGGKEPVVEVDEVGRSGDLDREGQGSRTCLQDAR